MRGRTFVAGALSGTAAVILATGPSQARVPYSTDAVRPAAKAQGPPTVPASTTRPSPSIAAVVAGRERALSGAPVRLTIARPFDRTGHGQSVGCIHLPPVEEVRMKVANTLQAVEAQALSTFWTERRKERATCLDRTKEQVSSA